MAERSQGAVHLLGERRWRRAGWALSVAWIGVLLVLYVAFVRREDPIPVVWLLPIFIFPSLVWQGLHMVWRPLHAVATLPVAQEDAVRRLITVLARYGRGTPKVARDGTSVTVRWFGYRWGDPRRLRVELTQGDGRTGLAVRLWSPLVPSASQRWLEDLIRQLHTAD